jgi:hypothetical protein
MQSSSGDALAPFGLHHTEPNLECPVGMGIRPALSQVYGRAVPHPGHALLP